MIPIMTGLTYTKARVAEQALISAFTLEKLVNMINSISPKRWNVFLDEFNELVLLMLAWGDPE